MTSRDIGIVPRTASDLPAGKSNSARALAATGSDSFKSMVTASESRHEEPQQQNKTQESSRDKSHVTSGIKPCEGRKSEPGNKADTQADIVKNPPITGVIEADDDTTLLDDALSVMEVMENAAGEVEDVVVTDELEDVASPDAEALETEEVSTAHAGEAESGAAAREALASIDLGSDTDIDAEILGQQSSNDTVAHLTGEKEAGVAHIVDTAAADEYAPVEEIVDTFVAAIDGDFEVTADVKEVISQSIDPASEGLAVAVTTAEMPSLAAQNVAAETLTVKSSGDSRGTNASLHADAADATIAVPNSSGGAAQTNSDAQDGQGQSMMQQHAGSFATEVTPDTLENLALQGFKISDEMTEAMHPTHSNVVLTAATMTAEGDRVFTFDVQPDVSPDINTVHEQVRIAVSVARAEGQSSFQIQLAPEHLGLIEIQMEVVGDRVTNIKMLCNRPETRDMLMKEAGMLIESVGKVMNAEDASLSFDLRSGEQNAQNFQQQNDGDLGSADGDAEVAAPHASGRYEKGNDVSSRLDVVSDDKVDMKV